MPALHPPTIDQVRPQHTSLVATILGAHMAQHRHQDRKTMLTDMLSVMAGLGIPDAPLSSQSTQHITGEAILKLVLDHIRDDTVYDSERAQATRAFQAVLSSLYGDIMLVRGWLSGEHITVGKRIYQLTGDACTECGVAPSAYRPGGGIGCTNRITCGYWTCMDMSGHEHDAQHRIKALS